MSNSRFLNRPKLGGAMLVLRLAENIDYIIGIFCNIMMYINVCICQTYLDLIWFYAGFSQPMWLRRGCLLGRRMRGSWCRIRDRWTRMKPSGLLLFPRIVFSFDG